MCLLKLKMRVSTYDLRSEDFLFILSRKFGKFLSKNCPFYCILTLFAGDNALSARTHIPTHAQNSTKCFNLFVDKIFHADEEATGELHQVFGRCTPCNKKQIDSILGWVWEGWIWGHPPKVIWNRIQKFFHCLTLQKGLTLHGNSNASSRDGAAHLYVESIT